MQKYTTSESLLTCNICGFLARDIEDAKKIKTDNCCTECYENFRFIYGKAWDLGKRPTLEESRSKMLIFTKRGKNG